MLLEQQEDNRLLINLKRCGKCNNIIELFKLPIEGDSFDAILYQIMQDKKRELKVKFKEFQVSCPQCHDAVENITFMKMTEDELNLVNSTPIANIWITVQDT